MTTKITTDNIQPNTVVTYAEWSDNLLPKVSNVSIANSSYTVLDDTAVNVGGGYIVVTGGGFQDGATVLISGTQATAVSYVNSSTLHVQVPAKSAATYNLYVVNPDGGTAIGPNKLTYSGVPTWVTDTTLTSQITDTAFNITFDATGAVSYANTTELPAGTELLANGYFYGTVSVLTDTTYNFTIRATDNENQDADRTFSLDVLVVSFYQATGGTITYDGDYKIHTFTSSGNFEVTALSVSAPDNNIEYLIVAGGGGSTQEANAGGGGGGGGFLTGNTTIGTTGTYSVVIGAGGASVSSGSTNNGQNSSALGFTAIGGGGSGSNPSKNGKSGGSGGGAYFYPGSGGAGTPGQGYNGGNATWPGTSGGSGGGGGAGSPGGVTNAGTGRLSPLSGSALYYAGGGGGVNVGSQPSPATGSGRNTSGNGAANSGQGASAGAAGGSGVVILKYKYQ